MPKKLRIFNNSFVSKLNFRLYAALGALLIKGPEWSRLARDFSVKPLKLLETKHCSHKSPRNSKVTQRAYGCSSGRLGTLGLPVARAPTWGGVVGGVVTPHTGRLKCPNNSVCGRYGCNLKGKFDSLVCRQIVGNSCSGQSNCYPPIYLLHVLCFCLECYAHLNRGEIEFNLSVPGNQGYHKNALYTIIKTSPNMQASIDIPPEPAQIQTWSICWPLDGYWCLPTDFKLDSFNTLIKMFS